MYNILIQHLNQVSMLYILNLYADYSDHCRSSGIDNQCQHTYTLSILSLALSILYSQTPQFEFLLVSMYIADQKIRAQHTCADYPFLRDFHPINFLDNKSSLKGQIWEAAHLREPPEIALIFWVSNKKSERKKHCYCELCLSKLSEHKYWLALARFSFVCFNPPFAYMPINSRFLKRRHNRP